MPENQYYSRTVKPEVIIFDLDGTLYDQVKLRRILMRKLLFRLLTFRTGLSDFRIISCFRKEREKKKGYASGRLKEEQYEWCAESLGLTPDRVRKSIDYHMQKFPLKFLKGVKFSGINDFFEFLYNEKIRIVVYSDYPIEEKLKALGLTATASYCSTHKSINQFKPSVKALKLICGEMKCTPGRMIYIGDRQDTDGEGARLAGIPFILLDYTQAKKGIFYSKLAEQLDDNHD